MAAAGRLEVGRLAQEAAALANVVRGSLGPQGGQVLLTRPTGEVLLSRDGRRVLEALNVESPTARMIISCISTHCDLIGDGAKTLIILLSDLLQRFEKLDKGDGTSTNENILGRENHQEKCYRLKQISQFLMIIQTDILDRIMTWDLRKHFLSIFSVSDAEIRRSMELVLEPYFCGKVGNNRQTFLSQLACDFYFKVTAGKNQSEALCLVNECFAELHTTMTGLPVSSSRILDGLLLQRDFAVYHPIDGNKKVIVITEPIHSFVSELGIDIVITAESQFATFETWISKQTEALLKHMQDNNIRVILSSVKQQEMVHCYAKNNGISIVDCLLPEEISLICRVAKLSPFKLSLDNSEITETAEANVCEPFQLGTKRLVHIGFVKTYTVQLHYVIFCGPVRGVTEQHASAFHEAFKMLRQMFTAVHLAEDSDSELESKCLCNTLNSSRQYSATQQAFDEEQADWRTVQNSTQQLPPCGFKMGKLSVSFPVKDEVCSFQCDSLGRALPSIDLPHNTKSLFFQRHKHGLICLQMTSIKYKYPRGKLDSEPLENNQPVYNTVNENINSGNEQLQASKDSYTCSLSRHLLRYEEKYKSNNQNDFDSYIEVGSVLPVGGVFEILLHHYLSSYAKQCGSPNTSIVCTIIADALLSIPKALCRTQKKNAFPLLCLEVTNALKNNQPLLPNQKLLESVSCKYHLVASVLQCTARLLSINLIVGIKRIPQKAEESDSEVDV